MNKQNLQRAMDRVSVRYRRLLLWSGLACGWLALALAGVVVLGWARGAGYAVPGAALIALLILPVVLLPILLSALRAVRNPMWVARRIERRFPDLESRLLAALEQKPDESTQQYGYLQQEVMGEAAEHARIHGWETVVVPQRRIFFAQAAQWTMLASFAVVVGMLIADMRRRPGISGFWAGGVTAPPVEFVLKVEPEDTSIERGTSLLVLARFNRHLPSDVHLLYRDADGAEHKAQMHESLDDPIFAGRVSSVEKELTYAVRYGDVQTRWFKVGVFDYPDLQRADAKLKYPQYTGLPESTVEDTHSITAVEGTNATFTFRLNKPVKDAQLEPIERPVAKTPTTLPAAIALKADPADPTLYTASMDLKQSQNFRLKLLDSDNRANKTPTELAINVVPNRPPTLKMEWPGHDVDVSPLEELSLKARVWDDFGVKRVGVTYAMAGQPPQDVTLAQNVAGKEQYPVAHLVSMEKLAAKPDQLLSYYLWVEDFGPDGKIRRTSGDMFFAEVRPFEEIYRQGEQPSESEQEQQQKDRKQNGNAQRAEEAADSEKEIIAATWKVLRRETSVTLSDKFVPDIKLISESQAEVREKSEGLEEKLTDPNSAAFLKSALKHMDDAKAALDKGAAATALDPLPAAVSAAQAAYQDLLKLRAREHDVVRSNRNRQQQQKSQSNASARKQRQLNQLDLSNEQNRYEAQRNASPEQQEDPQQRETRQVLNRLKELAQRQEDLNKQMKELQSSLDKAKDSAEREEIKRQLARLRDQQQQQLRDTDELRDRMDQPENQERMADPRQQLEQTRNSVRKASESLEKGEVPQASAAGARAGEELNKLRDDFRKKAAGEFGEAMNNMRDQARELDKNQQELSNRLSELTGEKPKRDPNQAQDPAERQARADEPTDPTQQTRAGQAREPNASTRAAQPDRQNTKSSDPSGPRARAGESTQAKQPSGQGQPSASGQGNPSSARGPAGLRSPSLRDSAPVDRQEIVKGLQQQRTELEKLLEDMRRTTEEAEATEPLLSKQLYDNIRDTRQKQTDKALDNSKELVDRGFLREAQKTEREAGQGITKLREGIEQAASSVLGDETEALRRARNQLDELAQQLDREIGARRPSEPATRPSGEERQLAQNTGENRQRARNADGSPTTRPGEEGSAQERAANDLQTGAERGNRDARQSGRQRQAGAQTQPTDSQVARAGRQPGQRGAGEPRDPSGQNSNARDGEQPGQDAADPTEQPGRRSAQTRGDEPGQPSAQAGQRGGNRQRGNQPGQLPGEQPSQSASAQPDGQQPGEQAGEQPGQGAGQRQGAQAGRGNRPGGQPGQRSAQRQPGGQENDPANPEGQPDPNSESADAGQPGDPNGRPGDPSGQPGAEEGQPGDPSQGQPGNAGQPNGRPGQARGGPGLRPQQGGNPRGGDVRRFAGGNNGGATGGANTDRGPLTGDNYRQWSDRLRDVEEMVNDPNLRAEAARIRERARAARADFNRFSKEPNWDMVQQTIGVPLAELREAVSTELLRRESSEALVPIDREPVPPEFAEQVRKYYERLGGGK